MKIQNTDLPTIREMLLSDQGGLCLICGKPAIRPVVDHHHKKNVGGTGKIRGVLCSDCNIFLAKIENNCRRYNIQNKDLPEILIAISEYLEMPQQAWTHPTENIKPRKVMKSSYNELRKILGSSCPAYPPSEKLTKPLEAAYNRAKLIPKFYK